jgi:hypothetical protein
MAGLEINQKPAKIAIFIKKKYRKHGVFGT